jgi:hypothetical protein
MSLPHKVERHLDTPIMSIEPAPVLHCFVPLATEADFLRLGWMRERPLKRTEFTDKRLGVWLMWPCSNCPPVKTPSGVLCGGWWQPLPTQ